MTAGTKPKELLKQRIEQIGSLAGWSIAVTGTGRITVTSPRGRLVLPPLAQWSDDSAETYLNRLNDKGLETALSRNGRKPTSTRTKTAPPTKRPVAAPATASEEPEAAPESATKGKTPPAYPGDPSPDDGLVVRDVLLTPTLARELLNRPWEATTSKGVKLRQRKSDDENVDTFAALMVNGEFEERLYQGLAIGTNGSLYDGKHRCLAVEKTGISVWVKITYNFPVDAVLALDSGRQRRTTTKLEMQHYEHPLMLGSAARLLHYVDEYAAALSLGPEAADEVPHKWRQWCNRRVTDRTVRKIVEDNDPQLYKDHLWAVEHKQDLPENQNRLMVPAVTVFRFTARRAWPQDPKSLKAFDKKLEEYLNAVLFKIGINRPEHIALTLHRWQGRQIPRARHNREAHLYALTKAWNLFIDPPKPPKKPVMSFPANLPGEFPLPIAGMPEPETE